MESNEGRAIPFIEIINDELTNKPIFALNPDAISILQEMKDKKIGVLVISGPQGSGKSFLANRVLNTIRSFKLASSVEHCTKGIWMWSQTVKLSEDHDFETIILDTEGLNSVQRDATIDAKLFTISLLLSSTFLYNSLGHIDEQALNDLSLATNIMKYLDFKLYLLLLSEYLDHCLQSIKGDSPEINKKNQIRTTINNSFKHRECHCLVRPVNDEKQLQKIEEVPIKNMKPLFLQGLNTLKEKIRINMKPKVINGKTLSGNMLLNMTFEYLEALNNESAPNIYTSLERIIHAETRKVCDNVVNEFIDLMSEEFSHEKMPFEEETIRRRYKELYHEGLKKFEVMTKDFAEIYQLIDLRGEIIDKMESEFEQKLQLNDELSQELCKKIIGELYSVFNSPDVFNSGVPPPSPISAYKEQFFKFYDNYKIFGKGPQKYNIFSEFIPKFLFEFFDKYQTSVTKIHQNEINNINKSLQNILKNPSSSSKTTNECSKERECKEASTITDDLETCTKNNIFDKILKEHDQIKQELKAQHQKALDDLKMRLEAQLSENAKLKIEVIDLRKTIENSQGKDQVIKNLNKNLECLTEEYNIIKNGYQVSVEVTAIFKKSIEESQLQKQELEVRIAEQASEIAKLKAEKVDILYAAKNAIKRALNQQNYFRESIRNLDQETADEIRQMFE